MVTTTLIMSMDIMEVLTLTTVILTTQIIIGTTIIIDMIITEKEQLITQAQEGQVLQTLLY